MVQAEASRGRGLGLSDLAPRVVQSEIRAMTQESDRVGGVNLAQGVCDTEVPQVVAEGAIKAIRDGHNIYTRMDGIARLRRAIAEKTERMQGLGVRPRARGCRNERSYRCVSRGRDGALRSRR